MISFHSLLLFLLMTKKKKIDLHHADHKNKKKKKNTSDAMTSTNQSTTRRRETHPCSLHAIPMCSCVFFFDFFECAVVVVSTKESQIIPNTGKSFFCFLIAFAFLFPSPRKKERKKEKLGRINCGDHGIINIERGGIVV